MLEYKNINNEVEYLKAMLNATKDNRLEIARYITDDCYVTSTLEEYTNIEYVTLNLNASVCDSIITEYNNLIDFIYKAKANGQSNVSLEQDLMKKFKDKNGYKKQRFLQQLKRVAKAIYLDAPNLILGNEKIMLMDFFVLYNLVYI